MEKKIREYAAGDRIITEGETGSEVMILVSGEVAVWRGRSELGRLSGHGDVIGELAALTGRPRSATVTAVTKVQMIVVNLDVKAVSKKNPEIIEKIGSAIHRRYEIARNKARMYAAQAAVVRRRLLLELMVQGEQLRTGRRPQVDTAVRKQMRRLMEEALEMYSDSDDPRVMLKLADQHGVLTEFNSETTRQRWLDTSLDLKMIDVENRVLLCTHSHTLATVREFALATVEMLDLLNEYESTPGSIHQMDLTKIEELIPHAAKVKAIRTVVRRKEGEMDELAEKYMERKITASMEKCKVSAGKDPVHLFDAARDLGVESEYEEELRRIIELSDTSSTFLDLTK